MTDAHQITIELSTPECIGGKHVNTIVLREFTARELIGIDMADLARLSVVEVAKLAPLISSPAMTPEEVYSLAPHNYLALAGGVGSFFTPPGERAKIMAGT